jgi:hypothetical protein
MADVLANVVKSQQSELVPGETFVAAAKVVKKTGALGLLGLAGRALAEATATNPPGVALADDMIWAVTTERLIIWAADRITGTKPKALLGTPALGREVFNAVVAERAPGAGMGKTYLTATIRGVPVAVEVKTADAQSLAAAIGAVLPPPPT